MMRAPSGMALCSFSTVTASSTLDSKESGDSISNRSSELSISKSIPVILPAKSGCKAAIWGKSASPRSCFCCSGGAEASAAAVSPPSCWAGGGGALLPLAPMPRPLPAGAPPRPLAPIPRPPIIGPPIIPRPPIGPLPGIGPRPIMPYTGIGAPLGPPIGAPGNPICGVGPGKYPMGMAPLGPGMAILCWYCWSSWAFLTSRLCASAT
mmetsp:Transcript_12067/g.34148  ORF Transcript_12067/g.34148 Transcript_12067/m.34148 type:complete len:208 (-) Transcript_12067:1997-2620(-)